MTKRKCKALEKLKEGSIYIVRNGIIELIDKPESGFGKTIIHWQDGKPITQEVSYTKKLNK